MSNGNYKKFPLDICQIRLDFKSTTRIGDPSAAANTQGTCDNSGLVIAPGATTTVGNSIPTLCGSVTGQHSKCSSVS